MYPSDRNLLTAERDKLVRGIKAAEDSERQLIGGLVGRLIAEDEDRCLAETKAELWPNGGAP